MTDAALKPTVMVIRGERPVCGNHSDLSLSPALQFTLRLITHISEAQPPPASSSTTIVQHFRGCVWVPWDCWTLHDGSLFKSPSSSSVKKRGHKSNIYCLNYPELTADCPRASGLSYFSSCPRFPPSFLSSKTDDGVFFFTTHSDTRSDFCLTSLYLLHFPSFS